MRPQNFTTIRLVPDIRLRREFFGGLVYDTRNGNILEVDRATFQFLRLIKDRALDLNDIIASLVQNNIIKKFDKSIDETLQKLLELKIIEKNDDSSSSPVSIAQDPIKINHKSWLSAPETVHWAVTYRCQESCPDCYARRFSFIKNELDTYQALKLIDKIAHWGVFQLAIGGGEPFIREDLPQLVHPTFLAGNLVESEPEFLWDQSRILRKYRSFRTKKTFTHSWCGICQAKDNCGGCRVFASDGLGGDPGCPEPLLPPLTQLGNIGRSLDLTEYLKNHHTISVKEYMDRYRVGQQKAIKELNVSPDAVSTTGKSIRKKRDTCQHIEEDIVLEVQRIIGFTKAGVPYVPYKQVSEWIESRAYLKDYPEWIRQQINREKKKGEGKNEDSKYT